MPKIRTLYDDVTELEKLKGNYYLGPEGEIVRVFGIQLRQLSDWMVSVYIAEVIKEFREDSDLCQNKVTIPLYPPALEAYKRISAEEIEQIRAKLSQLEASASSSPSRTREGSPENFHMLDPNRSPLKEIADFRSVHGPVVSEE